MLRHLIGSQLEGFSNSPHAIELGCSSHLAGSERLRVQCLYTASGVGMWRTSQLTERVAGVTPREWVGLHSRLANHKACVNDDVSDRPET